MYKHSQSSISKTGSITVIGPALIDIITAPVPSPLPSSGSQLVRTSTISYGGDALNEAVALSRFGKKTDLITLVGGDEAGAMVLKYIRANAVDDRHVRVDKSLQTSVHIVLVDERGERRFLMNEEGSARKLSAGDILPCIEDSSDIVSFASLFISPLLTMEAVRDVFEAVKKKPGRMLVVDMSRPKNHERMEDLKPLLPYVDYILPNQSEIAQITGDDDPVRNAERLTAAGAGCAVVKCGKKGCVVGTADTVCEIPAYPTSNCVDTTGAGDTFAAGFLWALSEGWSPHECGRFGNAAASCSVEHYGAVSGISSLAEPMRRYEFMRCSSGTGKEV